LSGLLTEIDRLYEGCVMEPEQWHDQAIADWAEAIGNDELDGTSARLVRRVLGVARRLVGFWDRASQPAPDDWRSRVDVALGAKAWRPQLELAEHLLETSSDEETFDVVAALFPLVRNQPFLDGIAYDDWLEGRGRT
jgi:hypothetical protein